MHSNKDPAQPKKIKFFCANHLLNLLQHCFCFKFWFFGLEACKILAAWPETDPTPSALEGSLPWNCHGSPLSLGEAFEVSSWIPLTCYKESLVAFFIWGGQDFLCSFCTFSAPDLKSSISPKSPDSEGHCFQWSFNSQNASGTYENQEVRKRKQTSLNHHIKVFWILKKEKLKGFFFHYQSKVNSWKLRCLKYGNRF